MDMYIFIMSCTGLKLANLFKNPFSDFSKHLKGAAFDILPKDTASPRGRDSIKVNAKMATLGIMPRASICNITKKLNIPPHYQ